MIRGVDIVRPSTLDEALRLRAELGASGMPIAGGTDVIVELRARPVPGTTLLDLSRLDEMKGVREVDGGTRIGALVTHEEAAGSALLRSRASALARACSEVGSLQIRNRGTLGGNVANAAPCADGLTALVCLDAVAGLVSVRGRREVPVEDLIEKPYVTGVADDELILDFFLPAPAGGARSAFVKLARRDALAISRINAACLIEPDGGRIRRCSLAVGSVMPRTRRVKEVEEAIERGGVGQGTAREAGKAAADRMIAESGVRWSTPYKEPAVRAVVSRAVLAAMGLNEGE